MSPLCCRFSLNTLNILVACTTGTGFSHITLIPMELHMSNFLHCSNGNTQIKKKKNNSNTLMYFSKLVWFYVSFATLLRKTGENLFLF